MNTTSKLVMMANQIAINLSHEPDPAAATADHILRYWDPRMRAAICQPGISGISVVAARALELIVNASDQ